MLRRLARFAIARFAIGLPWFAVLLVAVAGSGGCGGDVCIRNSDCGAGLTCLPTGLCETPLAGLDAGDGDAAVDAALDAASDAVADAPDAPVAEDALAGSDALAAPAAAPDSVASSSRGLP